MDWIRDNNKLRSVLMYVVLLVSLYLMTNNYLLFHAYAEGFSIVIAVLVFVLTWNARSYIDNEYLHFIGLAYLFVAHIDFLHMLGYSGMNVFTDYGYYANQLWVLGRYMESLTLLVGFYFLYKQKKCNDFLVISVYTAISALGILSIFVWKIFPIAFVEGVGQTSFKIISEYIIIGILILVLLVLRNQREHFDTQLLRIIGLSVIMTIIAELFFAFYIDNFGISNIMGHYFKIISFFMIYKSIVEKGIKDPYDIIFRNLEKKREQLAQANETKMKLFSIIGHDLKTPFNNLLGVLGLLTEDSETFSPKEQKQLFRTISESTKETYTLVQNLLEWASVNMDSIMIKMDDIGPITIIDKAVKSLRVVLDKKSLQLNILGDPQLTMEADANSFEVIIRNLLSNAIKYSHRGGTISIKVSELHEEISIQIEDHGQGMTSDQARKLMVSEINESTRGTANEKGTGLGFNIVKEFVERNQGRIEIDSEEGRGTIISLFFRSKA